MKTRVRALELDESDKIDQDELICELRDSFWHDLNSRCDRDAKMWAFYGAHYATLKNLDEHINHFHGLLQYVENDFQGAYKLLSKAIQVISGVNTPMIRHIQIWEDYVILLQKLYRTMEAYRLLPYIEDQYKKINVPPPVRFYIRACIICRVLERYGEVRTFLEKAGKVDANDVLYLNNRMVQLWEDHLLSSDKDSYKEDSIREMTSILGLMEKELPDGEKDASLMNNLGVLHYLKKDYKASIQYLKKALEINSEDAIPPFNIGLAEFRLENYEAAKSSFKEAQSWYLKEQNPGGYRNAELFFNISKMKQAGMREVEEDEKEFLSFLFNFLDTMDNHQNFFIERFLTESQFYEKLLSTSKSSKLDNQFVVLRGWHSNVPPAVDFTDSTGGGYFLRWRNSGILIDPGFHFIRNFFDYGFSIADIDLVIVTSSMSEHCNDFESLLSLVRLINDLRRTSVEQPHSIDPSIKAKLPPIDRKVDLIISADAKKKFSTQIDDTFKNVIGDVQLLDQEKVSLQWCGRNGNGKKPILKLTHTVNKVFLQHGEQHPVGILLELLASDNSVSRRVGYTSDTMWFNDLASSYEGCDVLIAHLGPIRAIEFRSEGTRDDKLNREHLGLFGCFSLIKYGRPKLFIVSDIGRELARRRSKIVGGFNKKFWLGPSSDDSTKVISSELGMRINLGDLTINTRKMENPLSYGDVEERFEVLKGTHFYV
jgi:tetratricopeptide (TPR) repeat protein